MASDELKDGEPCGHHGCLHHVTHPCEGCGRIGGRRNAPRIVGVDMAAKGSADFSVMTIRAVFDNNRYRTVTVQPPFSPEDVAAAMETLARDIREDPELIP